MMCGTLDSKELLGFFIFRRNLSVDWLYEPLMHFYVGRRKQTFYEGANEVKKTWDFDKFYSTNPKKMGAYAPQATTPPPPQPHPLYIVEVHMTCDKWNVHYDIYLDRMLALNSRYAKIILEMSARVCQSDYRV